MPHPRLLSIEKQLAAAHRIIWEAQQNACSIGLQGTSSDLFDILRELERIQLDAIGNRRRSRLDLRNPK